MIEDKILKSIILNIEHQFLTDKELYNLYTSVIKVLNGDEKAYFIQLDYLIYKYQSENFYALFIEKIFEIYSAWIATSNDKKNELKVTKFLYLTINHLFKQQYKRIENLQNRSVVIENVLHHMTSDMTSRLDIQQLMMANISHDMRTYLNAIAGYNMIAMDDTSLTTQTKGYLKKSNKAVKSLSEMVDDILSLSKINAGQLEIKHEWFWLDQVVLHSIDQVKSPAAKKGLDFQTDIAFFPYTFYGDSQRITEVLINLLSNAVKFTDSGYVSLHVDHESALETETTLRFTVKDSGIGMSEEALKTIFDPYSRFENSKQGIGLGMHITYSLVNKMGGTLSVKSELEKGSEFTFILTLKKNSHSKIDLREKRICLFNDIKEKEQKERVAFLKKIGATIRECHDINQFLTNVTNESLPVPDMVFISTTHNNYQRFNALISFLKSGERHKNTTFVAEETKEIIATLDAFDYINEYFSPMSIYINTLEPQSAMAQLCQEEISILVVDDIETNLEIFQLFVKKIFPDITIHLATGGYEAIGMCKIKKYDLIFLDLKMPGLDGFALFSELKKMGDLPTTYALTADVYQETFNRVLEYGFDGLLEKPIQLDALTQVVNEALYIQDKKRVAD